MWSASEEPLEIMEEEVFEPVAHAKEKCEQNKSQLETLKEIMLKNKQSLKKKEEEVQEYARRLSKIKSRAKLSRRNREGNLTSKDVTHTSEISLANTSDQSIDDISQAKTVKAKSTLLQKKLAENRKAFEQRNKEIIETKRAVEEKVEAIRQQLEEKDVTVMGFPRDQLSVTPVKPVMITSDIMSPIQIESFQGKENKIAELNNKILELEAVIMDLQENLKEKDSVIESKTKAVTLMSADLSKKERDSKIVELEDLIDGFKKQINKQKLSESASADFSRSTMDALVESKEVMKSMQENFVLIESSLKTKNENLLQQLKDYELKLAEANERIFKLESGIGIVRDPIVSDLQFKLEKLEHNNKQLQDEKYELQKNVAELQDKIVNISMHGNGAIMEKDNRIVELENLVEELKQSNKLLEEESKAELQNQVADLILKNEEYLNKITDLENLVHKLEEQKNEIIAKLPEENTIKEDEKVMKLTKELEELNKSMIKIKAQHKSKVKSLQKQLENFKKMSDTNAELVKLGNQVALLEEEKGNLQLSLVDFDELKASAGDWQERVVDLENKVSAQAKEIEMQIEAIATLENQKLDLMQELHIAKREISSLEAENAESENLRVTAEMKVVDLEEQLEALHRLQNENKSESSSETNHTELIKQVETLTQENAELYNRISKFEEKGTSDTGSTESFEAIQELDKIDLLKKIEDLTQKNNELTLKLNKLQQKENFYAESMESINDTDKNGLLKKIDQLTQENTDLTVKLSRMEEKGSSDTGSTESFERIPEHNENMTKIELLTQENSELVIKLTKLEEQLGHIESKSDIDLKLKIDVLLQENDNQSVELSKLKIQVTDLIEENSKLQKQIEILSTNNSNLATQSAKLEDQIENKQSETSEISKREVDFKAQIDMLIKEKDHLQKEVKELRTSFEQWHETTQDLQINDLRIRIEELLKENEEVVTKVSELKHSNQKLKENLTEVIQEKEELYLKINQMLQNKSNNEKLEFNEKSEKLDQEKKNVAQNKEIKDKQIGTVSQFDQEVFEIPQSDDSLSQQRESMIIASLEHKIEECKTLIAEQTDIIKEMKIKLAKKEEELKGKDKQIAEYENSEKKVKSLEKELKKMFSTLEEWKYKSNELQEKVEQLEAQKISIEDKFKILQNENKMLLHEKENKDAEIILLKQQLQNTTTTFELKLQEQLATISEKYNEITHFKEIIEDKNQELQTKYMELQNKMITIDSLQDELNNCKILIQDKDSLLTSMSDEVVNHNNLVKSKEEEIHTLRKDIVELNNKVKESMPVKDYNALIEQLKDKNMILDELDCKISATTKENSNLLEKVKNLSQQNNDIQNELIEKQREFVDLLTMKDHLEAQIVESKNEKSEVEKQILELQSIVDNNSKFANDLQAELKSTYKQIEQLKVKHTEDIYLQNQRLENVIEELNAKMQECEILKGNLEEKERLVGYNITEETKVALETKVADLEQKLKDSDDKIQMQLEKMKKIAANLKKKTAMCQELESRVTELEEKWTTEKDEKEAKNKQIQDVEIAIREKDNRIADLEEKLVQARSESTEASKNIEKLTHDLSNLKEIPLLMQQITEMEEEIVKLRQDIESSTVEFTRERESKQKIISEYESYKQQVIQENERKQSELEDMKEKARELSVRMQVMETEYVEQLTLINDLKAENGLLLSKQAHINEKLETVEKESEKRKLLIEQLEKTVVNTSMETTQTAEEETIEDDAKMTGAHHCNHCEQFQTLVQALEAKLQEREAEIENLDNELANSNCNFVQMRESLRYNDLMNQTSMRNRSLEDSYNDLFLEQEIETLKVDKESSEKRIGELQMELEVYRNQSKESMEKSKKETPVFNTALQDNAPQLFDASKIFGTSSTSDSDLLTDKEMKRLQTLLNEKETQCSNLTQEINHLQKMMIEERTQISQNYSQCVEKLEISQKQLHAAETNIQKLEQVLVEKEKQIDSLIAELRNLSMQVVEQQNDIDNKFKESLLAKDIQIEELNMSLISIRETLDKVITDRNQQNGLLESYKSQINNLETELKNLTDFEVIQELENYVSVLTKERDLLQLQVNDLSRSMEKLKDSMNGERNLQVEIEKTVHERDEARELVANLTRTLEDAHKQSDKTLAITDTSTKESIPLEKETWEWNAEDAQLASEQHLTTTLIPSIEIQLQARIDDLQDQIKDFEKEKEKIIEESKAAQLRNTKMIKKLKEYKVQIDSLQQQLKIQKPANDFYELDSAIEEELKSQISKLEKTLSEIKEEHKNTVVEKEALMKRLDVVVSANERYMEMKERQDMDMEVLRIRNKELSDKVDALDKKLQESAINLDKNDISQNESIVSSNKKAESVIQEHSREKRSLQEIDYEILSKNYKDEIDDLKDEIEALATENEQLQHFLAEQKKKLFTLESKRTAEENESIQIVDDLNKRISELQGTLNKSREEYDLLRKQYEQSLMDANDQVTAMRQNTDLLKEEAFEKTSKLEMEISELRQQIETSVSNVIELQKKLQEVLQQKIFLEKKLVTSEKQLSSVNASMMEVTDLLNIRVQEVADLKQEFQRQYVDHEDAKIKLQSAIQDLSQELNEKKQQLETLKKSLSEKENECIQQQSVETVSALISQATQELVQKHAIEIEEKEKQIRDLNERSVLEIAMNEYLLKKDSSQNQFDAQELELLKQKLMEKESTLTFVQMNLTSIKDQFGKKEIELSESKEKIQKLSLENQKYSETIEKLRKHLNESEATSISVNEYILRIQNLEQEIQNMNVTLINKESILLQYIQEIMEQKTLLDNNKIEIDKLRTETQTIVDLKSELLGKTEQIDSLNLELEETRRMLEETRYNLNEKISLLEKNDQMLNEKQMEIDKLLTIQQNQCQQQSSSNIVDGLPIFRMGNDEENLQRIIDTMQVELENKQEEIEHLKYILNENTYPNMIQEMQQRINCLYNEKVELESALEVASIKVEEKEKQINSLKQQIEIQNQESISKEEANLHSKDRGSMQDQEQIVTLQNEMYAKEQEINELKYIIAEKDSQLSLQISMEPQSDEFELHEMVQRLTSELYRTEQEIQHLKSTIVELQREISRLQEFERLSETTKETVQKFSAEKEQIRLQAQEFLEKKLKEKETEIDEIKQKLAKENQNVLDELRLRGRDIENLTEQLKEFSMTEKILKNELHQKDEELIRMNSNLAEKVRRLAELSITKDAELHNLKIQIYEKEERIEELLALYDKEQKQLIELKNTLAARETEINSLKTLLEDKVKEYQLIQNVLKKDVPMIETSVRSIETSSEESKTSTSQELDVALYMLHQRDIRCEELTHELMQLLEERDTLQLRLSNAIRVNEELRKMSSSVSSDLSPKKEMSSSGSVEPIVEHPSPSKSEGPIEIAKEAIDAPIGEDKESLVSKLSQLQTVSHAKDVRLRDERELRHTQQMSLLAHKDVLSTLPPEAAARLINANYTLSRDVQSQSSVLLNWLWGKR
ncbi:Protein lava lamp [Melipona quadrifasciata]|uniref:Protein lava lamp n=1 Tax=Melipona quadrifasciata TaxID=166423 RepID=A0A0M9ABW7_9HYME|nr:Protein lava lamp [Melipona quadrifasciata]